MTPPDVERWVVDSAPAYAAGSDVCHPKPVPTAAPVPAGLRVRAHIVDPACPEWSYVRWDPPGWGMNEPWAHVETARLSDTPPKDPWKKAPSLGTVYADQPGEKPLLALPLDEPGRTAPLLLSEGEALESLAPQVVRTSTGRVGFVEPRMLRDQPPTDSTWTSAGPLLARLHAGRTTWEKGHALEPLPPAEVLAKTPAGGVYWFELDPATIVDRSYTPEWFDPVGAVLTHTCGKSPKPDEPCGTYTLDFSPLGAWWPDARTEVIATWDGHALAVRVLDPWKHTLAVTPGWAE